MARIVLVTGGSRSGKSAHAQQVAEAFGGPRAYLATCVPGDDDEMLRRVRRHQEAREAAQFTTVEEPIDIAGVIRRQSQRRSGVVLIDCLSLWISNLMMRAHATGVALDEAAVVERCREVLAAAERWEGAVVMVTSEVGLSVVPDNAVARLYRDLLGRCNQTMAAAAHSVTMMVCGLPLSLKPQIAKGLT